MRKPKTYKTLSGIVRATQDRLAMAEARAEMQGRQFDWTANATPAARNILQQLLAGDVKPEEIPEENLAQWIADFANTEAGKKRTSDLKKISAC